MGLALAERNDRTPGKEAPELRLLRRPADLRDDGRGRQWKNTKLQTGFVFSPDSSLVSIGRHEHRGIVHDLIHAERFAIRCVRSCSRTR